MSKLKRYFVEFEYKTQVRGYVMATSMAQAKKRASECSNPDFDEMLEYTQPSEPEIEFEACYPDEE